MSILRHRETVGEYIYDDVRGTGNTRYAVSTVRLKEPKRGRAYLTQTFLASEFGVPNWDSSISAEYSTNWDKAKEIHREQVEWAEQ